MKRLSLLTYFILNFTFSEAQSNLIPRFIRKMYFDKDTNRRTSFALLPVVTSSPETGIEFGGAGLLSFYTDKTNRNTRVSSLFGYATVTTKTQSRFSLSTSYWTPGNGYHISASVNYINFPSNFYGIGNNTLAANAENIDEKRLRATAKAEKLIFKNFYAGLSAGLVDYKYSDHNNFLGVFETDPQVQNRSGGANVYIGPSIVFDSRNNNTYTTKGIELVSYFNGMQGIFGNNGYTGGFWNTEYSQYFLLDRRLVLGIDIQEQSLVGGQSPFYLLPVLGSDEMMRGYFNGRYRDRNFIAGQTELRFRLSQRFGIVGFVGTGEVFHTGFSTDQLKPDYGGGIRYFFDLEKSLSVRLDYGIGQKNPGEARQAGFYVALGEAF